MSEPHEFDKDFNNSCLVFNVYMMQLPLSRQSVGNCIVSL